MQATVRALEATCNGSRQQEPHARHLTTDSWNLGVEDGNTSGDSDKEGGNFVDAAAKEAQHKIVEQAQGVGRVRFFCFWSKHDGIIGQRHVGSIEHRVGVSSTGVKHESLWTTSSHRQLDSERRY